VERTESWRGAHRPAGDSRIRLQTDVLSDPVTPSPTSDNAPMHVAQLNVGRLRAPMDDPLIDDFRVNLDPVTRRNVRAAAREELIHYEVLTSPAVGGKEVTKQIHVPNAAFASAEGLLKTLVAGDQIFVNAYLLGMTVFARQGGLTGSRFARYLGEFMAVEAVHRALALQSLGRLGNDRVFMKFAQKESVTDIPTTGLPGFYRITDAVTQLEAVRREFLLKRPSAAGTAHVHVLTGNAYERNGQLDRALEAYERGLTADPLDLQLYQRCRAIRRALAAKAPPF